MTTALNGLLQFPERLAQPMGASVDLGTPSPRQSPPGTAPTMPQATALSSPPAAALTPPPPPPTSSAAAPLLSTLRPPPTPTPTPPTPTPPAAAAPLFYAFRCPTNSPAAYHENEAEEDEVQKNEQRARGRRGQDARERAAARPRCWRPGGRPGTGMPETSRHRDMRASSNARQRNRRGAAPKHCGGKQHKGGNRPQGNPTRQPPPHRKSSTRRGPRCKIGRGGRRSSDFCVKQRAPPTAGPCSHRVAEKLYASKENPQTSA